MKKNSLVLALLILFCVDVQASIVSNFSWIPSGANNSANTILSDGTVVTLSTDTVPFEIDSSVPNSASIQPSGDSTVNISLSFSRTITDLRLLIDDLDSPVETLDNFSIVPTSVNGFLTLDSVAGVVNPISFDYKGNLIWNSFNSSSITFAYNRPVHGGFLYLEEFEISAVPVPAAVWLMGSGLVGLVGFSRKNKTQITA